MNNHTMIAFVAGLITGGVMITVLCWFSVRFARYFYLKQQKRIIMNKRRKIR
jgi:hypothetical protein